MGSKIATFSSEISSSSTSQLIPCDNDKHICCKPTEDSSDAESTGNQQKDL